MSSFIKKELTENFPIKFTRDRVSQLSNMVRGFEIKKTHPLILNGNLLGVHDIKFLPEDRAMLFEIFGYDEEDITEVINKIPSINKEWKVSSDTFNIFCSYLIWSAYTSPDLNNTQQKQVLELIFLYFQYKLFSSIVNNHFQHGADEEVMSNVIESISNKFDIKVYGTWKKIMVERTNDLILSKQSVFYITITRYDNDENILKFIAGVQTRIRNQINTIAAVYYNFHSQDKRIKNANIDLEVDGDRILREQQASIDIMKSVILAQLKFGQINERYMLLVSSQFSILNNDLLKKSLLMLYYIYQDQIKKKQTMKVIPITDKKENSGAKDHLIGIEILIENLVIGTLKILSKGGSDLRNKVRVLNLLKRAFTASRLNDINLLNVKYSLKQMVLDNQITRREATISSLIPGIELYLVLVGISAITKDT